MRARLLGIPVAALLLAACGPGDRVAGGSVSETGNAIVAGRILDSGAAAAGAAVVMVPVDYHPLRGSLPLAWRVTADSSGRFVIRKLKPGLYNLEAARQSTGRKLLIAGITVAEGDTLHIPPGTLRVPGTLLVPLPQAGSFLYLRGTTRFVAARPVDGLPEFAALDSVAPGTAVSVFAWAPGVAGPGTPLGAGVVAASQDTVAVSNLPSPWNSGDIGQTLLAGGAAFSGNTWVLTGSGADTNSQADDFHYLSQPWTGDVTLQARIAGVESTDSAASASLMFRDSLTPGSRQINLALLPAGQAPMYYRITPGTAATRIQPMRSYSVPYWLRLQRRGNLFEGFVSADGLVWESVGSQTLDLPATLHVGLAVVSRNPGKLCTAVMDGVSVGP